MKTELFRVDDIFDSDFDKEMEIYGPDLTIRVDYDDVDHKAVENNVKKMLKILNENWEN
jgi:hypothetical protein